MRTSVTAALREAHNEVSMSRFGNAWAVNTWDEDRKAWWSDSAPGDYWRKRQEARQAVIDHALRHLGWNDEQIDEALYSPEAETGRADDVVRWFAGRKA